MIRLIVDGLSKTVDDLSVVDQASLEGRPGELVAVLGPSGAGKSTLARLIAGLDRADAGDVYFNGRLMNALPPHERRIGMVFQDDAFWPHLTVAENVGLGLNRLRGAAGRKQRRELTEDALQRARIAAVANRRPGTLTEVQRVRAALAWAIAGGPDLLILDEPLGRLSGRARDELRDELRQLQSELEITTLLLTREAPEALAISDRLAVMDLGRIVQQGSPSEVYNTPADAVVAQFLGPVNLLQGQVESMDARGEPVVRTPLGRLVGRIAHGRISEGSAATVAIRPDALIVGGTVPSHANRFAATLERQTLLGEVRRLYLRGPGDWPIMALVLQAQSRGFREGQSLTVSVLSEFVVVLPRRHGRANP